MRSPSLVLLFLFAGVTGAAELTVRDLPPFTIALPDGEIKKQSPLSGAGALIMMLNTDESVKPLTDKFDASKLLPAASRQIQVQWDPSVISTDQERKMMLDAVIAALPMKNARLLREKTLPSDRKVYAIGSEEVPIGVAFLNCGSNVGITITTAFSRDVDMLMTGTARVASSVQCKAESAVPPRLQASYRLPKNFGRKYSEGVDIVMSSDGEMIIAGMTPQDIQRYPDMLEQIMSSIFSQALGIPGENMKMEKVPAPKNRPKGARTQTLVLRTQGDFDGAYINFRYCEAQDLSLFTVWYATDPEIARAHERFEQVGCPGEPGEPLLAIDEMFAAECKAGNEYACEMVKEVDKL